MFQLIPPQHTFRVAGRSDSEAVGAFSGVVARGLRAGDPVAASAPEEGSQGAEPEGPAWLGHDLLPGRRS